MTDETKPLENSAEKPAAASAAAPAAAPATAPATAQVVEATVAKVPGRGRAWWILSSTAGAALLVIGLLGGILIGQGMHGFGLQGRTAHVFVERGQSGQPDQLPQRLKDRFQQRQDNQQREGLKHQPTPQPSAPTTGSGG